MTTSPPYLSGPYIHATWPHRVPGLLRHGFRLGRPLPPGPDESPDDHRAGFGYLGYGVYVSKDPQVAFAYGNAFLRVQDQSRQPVLNTDLPSDPAVLRTLKRKYGHAILESSSLRTILPANKQLTLPEAIALTRHTLHKLDALVSDRLSYFCRKPAIHKKVDPWFKKMHEVGRYLQRFHFSGFGSPDSHFGVLFFNPASLQIEDILPAYYETDFDDTTRPWVRNYQPPAAFTHFLNPTRPLPDRQDLETKFAREMQQLANAA